MAVMGEKKNTSLHKNNRGAALITVIVALAFVGMLVAMIVYMSYYNYQMKGIDKAAKDNFYSAETALDVINAGLQKDISTALSEAYVATMQNSEGKETLQLDLEFKKYFQANISQKLAGTTTPPDFNAGTNVLWSYDLLKGYLQSDNMISYQATRYSEGAWLDDTNSTEHYLTLTDGSCFRLKNINLEYTDSRGYVSIIQTDIRIDVPSFEFGANPTNLNIEDYAIIANERLIEDGTVGAPTAVTIKGNVFGGNDGVYVDNNTTMTFADDTSAASYLLIANKLNVSNNKGTAKGLYTQSKFKNYVENIYVQGGTINLDGNTYVKDDLTIDGRGSTVTLKGKYIGYGNNVNDSGESSSILINGANSTLDFSNLKNLTLAGHAFVGTRHYDADIDRYASGVSANDISTITSDYVEHIEEFQQNLTNNKFTAQPTTIPENTSDVMMGESMTVKANQLIYMVPANCVGYNKTTKQTLGKNPITYDEYVKLTTSKTVQVDASGNPMKDALGNDIEELTYDVVNMEPLWIDLEKAFTNNYKAVFRRVNGSVLVYLYMDFGGDEAAATDFFRTYYDKHPEEVEQYVKSYVSDIKWNGDLRDNANFALAGQVFFLNSRGDLWMQEENLSNDIDKTENMILNSDTYKTTYEALMHLLTEDSAEVSSLQLITPLFDNIVDSVKVKTEFGTKTYATDDDSIRAVVTKEDYVYNDISDPDNKVRLIISLGDVTLKKSFDGLVMAKGDIIIEAGCDTITYNPNAVRSALRANKIYSGGTLSDSTLHVYDALIDGKDNYEDPAGGALPATDENEYMDIADFIKYENWKKE